MEYLPMIGLGLRLGLAYRRSGGGGVGLPDISITGYDSGTSTLSIEVDALGTVYGIFSANATEAAGTVIAGTGDLAFDFATDAEFATTTLDTSSLALGSTFVHVVLVRTSDGAASAVDSEEVDIINPYLVGLIGMWKLGDTLGSAADLSGNGNDATIADNGAGNITITTLGGRLAASFDGAATAARYTLGSITSANPLSLVGASVATVIFRVAGTGSALTTTSRRLIDKSDGGNAANGWAIWADTLSQVAVAAGGATGVTFSAGSFQTATTPQTYGVEFRPTGAPGSHKLYRGGALLQTLSATLNAAGAATTNAALGNWNHSTDRMWESNFDFLSVWNRELTAAEHAAIHADPTILGI